MGWEIKSSGAQEKPPVGNHRAVLVGLFDMGHQWQEPFSEGDKGYYQHRAFFVWELVDEQVKGTQKNHVIGIDLTLSVKDTAKLYKWVKARTGTAPGVGFNPVTELGGACLLNVVENKAGYPKVDGMSALPKGMAAPVPTYPLTAVSLDEFQTKPAAIPEWCPWLYGSHLADHIRACKEIGQPKPEPKKSATKPAQQQSGGFPSSTSAPQGASNPEAKWDISDGTSVERGITSVALQELINSNPKAFAILQIKPHGAAPGTSVGTPKEYGFTDVIPF
jgi:hypothetical protein